MRRIIYKIIAILIKKSIKYSVQLAMLLAVGSIAVYQDKGKEFIAIFVGFQIGRVEFVDKFHGSTLVICAITSAVSFGLVCQVSLGFSESIIIQIILGLYLALFFSVFEVCRKKHKWFERKK